MTALEQLTEKKATLTAKETEYANIKRTYEVAVAKRDTAVATRDALPRYADAKRAAQQLIINQQEAILYPAYDRMIALQAEIASLKSEIASLQATVDSQNAAAQTLAQQGLTPQAVEQAAIVKATAEAEEIQKTSTDTRNMRKTVFIAVAIIAVVGLGVWAYFKFIKK